MVEELLCAILELRHYDPFSCNTPTTCLQSLQLSLCCCSQQRFSLLIIGDHPQTSFSWRHVVEQVRTVAPDLPIVLISNTSYYETSSIEQQLHSIRVLGEPFRLNDLYTIIDDLQ